MRINNDIIEELLEEDYWVIDIMPRQVPADKGGQYFAVEEYFLKGKHKEQLHESFAQILLKLNCYHDLLVRNVNSENWQENPNPEELVRMIARPKENVCFQFMVKGMRTMITFDSTDSYMTVYNPSAGIKSLLQKLVPAYGLSFYQPPGGKKKEREKKLREWRVM